MTTDPVASRVKLSTELRDLCLHFGMRALPTRACSDLGAWLGATLGPRGHPTADARVRALFAQLRPDLAVTLAALEANVRLLWQNVGRTYAEFAAIQRIIPEGRAFMSGQGRLEEVYADDRPVILCFVHLGNWELLARQVSAQGLIKRGRRFTAVVMPPANRAQAYIASRCRASLPVELVPMGQQVWRVVGERLRRPGGIVWLAADEAANGRVHAPHFGRRLRVTGNLGKIVRLAAATGARVLPMYNERIGTARFHSHILPVMDMPQGRLSEDELEAQVLRIDALFAPIVQRLLTQWYMAVEFGAEPDDPTLSPNRVLCVKDLL